MRRDSIFYALFQQSPTLLFELLETPPTNAEDYRFDSVAVKEPRFEIDGVFLPPESETPGIVFFCEVQFQKDEQLYERLFGESFLYFYRNRALQSRYRKGRFSDWQSVVIYPSRPTEQQETRPFEDLLNGRRVHRIYLNELGAVQSLPLGSALMVLTTTPENQAVEIARELIDRVQQAEIDIQRRRGIIEMITTILVYKFAHLSRREIEQMLGTALQQTRVYQEAKEEGREEGKQEERRSLILLLLNQKVGALSDETIAQISTLNPEQLESLAIALLNFNSISDLADWLENSV